MRYWHCRIDEDIVDPSRLYARFSTRIVEGTNGIVPIKLLFCKYTCVKYTNVLKLGIVPVNLLLYNDSTIILLLILGSLPLKSLSLRPKYAK